jgi:uncharacterized protein (DUF433 family)
MGVQGRQHDAAQLPVLGRGAYDLAEVARLTQEPYATVRSWFKGRTDDGRARVFASDYRVLHGQYAVSFLDLVDVYVAAQLRHFGVSLRVIRKAYDAIGQQLNVRHAFAHSEIFTDGRAVFLRAANSLGEQELQDAISRQQFFLIVAEKLSKIDYGEVDQIAKAWRIAESVVVNPTISRGRPVVQGTGIPTWLLARAYHANAQRLSLVAHLYGVSEASILRAVDFERQYGRRRAA